jgi:hypothetical protein
MTTHPTPTNPQIRHINKVIAAIRSEDQAVLDMAWFMGTVDPALNKNQCGTSACIAGFSYMVSTTFNNKSYHGGFFVEEEGPKFGLDDEEASNLFLGFNSKEFGLDDITKTMAIAALEDVRRTGRFLGWDDYAHLNPELQD